VAIASVDALNCYNRIAHTMTSMIFQAFGVSTVVPMEITFMNLEDEYKKYGTLRSLRYIYSNPFRFLISSLGLPNFPSQKS
jgi:hypothetical protein